MTEFSGFDELVVELNGISENAEKLADDAPDRYDAEMEEVAESVVRMAAKLAPKDTGRLAESISYVRMGLLSYRVGSPLARAAWMEFGTPPHPITGSPLHFVADGEDVFVTKVNHPGTEPQPFLNPSLEAHSEELFERLNDVTVELLTEAME